MRELVTIIVPVYNGSRYLDDCVESILYQTYNNIELILVNDGSIDNSIDILKRYEKKDKRIRIIDKENSGVSLSRNAALDIATGDYVCMVDQDDMLEADYVEYFLDLINKTNADIAVTPKAKRFCGNIIMEDNHVGKGVYEVISGHEAAIKMLYYQFVIAPWNKMIRRDLIERNNIRFDKRLFGGEGFLFSIECFQVATRVAVGNQEVYCYRIDNVDSGVTKYQESVIRSSIKAQQVIEEKIINRTTDIMSACRYANWHTHCDCLNTFIGCNAILENRELYDEIKIYCKKNAFQGFREPISFKEKVKVFLYWINPYWGARIINILRKRKFTQN